MAVRTDVNPERVPCTICGKLATQVLCKPHGLEPRCDDHDDGIEAPGADGEEATEVLPENSTVLGYDNAADYWPNLRFDDAIARQRNPLIALIAGKEEYEESSDVHLSVPYEHPQEPFTDIDDMPRYRVRPNFDGVTRAERRSGTWFWVSPIRE